MTLLSYLTFFGICIGSLYSLIAIGISLSQRVGGFLNFAHAGTVLVAAYVAYAGMSWSHGNIAFSMLVSIAIACCLAVTCELFIFRPLKVLNARNSVLMVASLGIVVVLQNCVAICFGDQTIVVPYNPNAAITIIALKVGRMQIGGIIAALLILGGLAAIFRTKWGLRIIAVANDRQLAEILGIQTYHSLILVTLIGAATGAVAGFLWACNYDVVPASCWRVLVYGLVTVIVSGSGSPAKLLVAGVFVGLVQHLSIWIFPTQWQDSLVLAVMVGFLLCRPRPEGIILLSRQTV